MTASEKPSNKSQKSMSALQILGRTFSLYKDHFNLYFGYAAWLFVPMVIAILAFVTLDAESFELVNIALLLFSVLILAIWVQIMSIQLTYIFEKKKTARMKKLSSNGWKLLIPYLLISIVTASIALIGYMFLVIPGLIAGVLLIFASTIVVIENKPIGAAIKSSVEMAKKDFWPLVWKLIVGYIVIFALYGIGVAAIQALGWQVSGMDLMSYLQTDPTLLEDLLLKSLSVILIPILSIFHTLLYLDAKN